MSILQVETLRFENTGNNRIYYASANTIKIDVGGVTALVINSTSFAVNTSFNFTSNSSNDGSGGGSFNRNLTDTVGYQVNTSLSTALTASSNTSERFIVRSIHVTNIGTANANITGNFSGDGYANIAFCESVPVPTGSSVELLKKSKVMNPSNTLRLFSNNNTALHASITYEKVSSDAYFGNGVDITTSNTYFDLHVATANSVLESILLSNDSSGNNDVLATVVWTNNANSIQGYYCYEMVVPVGSTIELLEQPKFLQNGYKIRVMANQPDRLEAIVSGRTV